MKTVYTDNYTTQGIYNLPPPDPPLSKKEQHLPLTQFQQPTLTVWIKECMC